MKAILLCALAFLVLVPVFTEGQNESGGSATARPPAASALTNSPARDGWDIARLDTARNVGYMSAAEKDIILELNMLRSDPRRYAELYIRPRLAYYNGRQYSGPGYTNILLTEEGAGVVEECYNALIRMESVQLLYPREGLAKAARDHVRDTGPKGITGHDGTDGSDPQVRSLRYGDKGAGENLAFGDGFSPREVVVQLTIDDGVPGRGHRVNNMYNDYDSVGAAVGSHARYTTMTAINFSTGYVTRGNAEEIAAAERVEANRVSAAEARLNTRNYAAYAGGGPNGGEAGWDIALLDTGRNADYLSGMAKDLLLELNMMRTNPRKYADYIFKTLARMWGRPVTSDDISASLYNSLAALPAVPPLRPERGLSLALGAYYGRNEPFNVARYGALAKSIQMPVVGTYAATDFDVMAFLLQEPEYMKILMSPEYEQIGIFLDYDMNAKFYLFEVIYASGYTSH
jgi:uncharacterized protein YkwD